MDIDGELAVFDEQLRSRFDLLMLLIVFDLLRRPARSGVGKRFPALPADRRVLYVTLLTATSDDASPGGSAA